MMMLHAVGFLEPSDLPAGGAMDTAEMDRLLEEARTEMDAERERCLAVGALLSDLPLDRAISILRRSLEAAERVAAMRANI